MCTAVDDGVPTPVALGDQSGEEWTHVDPAAVPPAAECEVAEPSNVIDGILSTIRKVTDDALRSRAFRSSEDAAPLSPPPGSNLVCECADCTRAVSCAARIFKVFAHDLSCVLEIHCAPAKLTAVEYVNVSLRLLTLLRMFHLRACWKACLLLLHYYFC